MASLFFLFFFYSFAIPRESAASNYQRQLIYQSLGARRGTVKWLTVYRHSNLEAAKRSKTVANLRVKPRLTWYNYEIQKPLRKIYDLYFFRSDRSPWRRNGSYQRPSTLCASTGEACRIVINITTCLLSLRLRNSNGFIIAANKFFGLTTPIEVA